MQPITILVVDDRPINREFLAMLLGYSGYRVLEAKDGIQALDIVRKNYVSLIISDILMPVMDGIELANQVHADESIAAIPIIFYTATYRATEAKILAQSCQVTTVIAKPAEPQEILEAVNEMLGAQAKIINSSSTQPVFKSASFPDLSGLQARLQIASRAVIDTHLSYDTHVVDSNDPVYAPGNIQALSLRTAALLELGLSMSAEHDPQQLLDMFCRAAQDIMNARHIVIGISHDVQQRRYAQRGVALDDVNALFAELDQGLLHDKLLREYVIRTGDVELSSVIARLAETHPLRYNALVVPIKLKASPYGWLYVADKLGSAEFNGEDEQFAEIMAMQFASFYENIVLFNEIQQRVGELEIEVYERKQVTKRLQESEVRFRQLAENIREVFFLVNHDNSELLYVSPAYEPIWGTKSDKLFRNPLSWLDSVHPADKDRVQLAFENRVATSGFDLEFRIVAEKNEVKWIRKRGFAIRDETGSICRFASIADDITVNMAQTKRISSLNRLYAVLSGINSAIVRIHDRQELFKEACRVAVVHGGFNLACIGVVAENATEGNIVAWHGESTGDIEKFELGVLKTSINANHPACAALREMHPVICNDIREVARLSGLTLRPYLSVGAWPMVAGNQSRAVLCLFSSEEHCFDEEQIILLDELASDLAFGSQYIEKEEKLDYLAYYDVLTGLPNNTLFRDRLTQFIQSAKHNNKIVATIIVDLHHFAHLNDAMGEHVSVAVFREAAKRLSHALQEPFTLARIRDDRFAIAVTDLARSTDLMPILENQVFAPFEQFFLIDKQEITIAVQTGLALYPDDGHDAESLMRHAEVALNKAQSSGKRFMYYAPQMNAAIATRMTLEKELRCALEERQFVMHYQPRVDLRSGQIVSAEALIRWQHPERGLLAPGAFISIAEESGLIVPIGAWVIATVFEQQIIWKEAGCQIVPVAINLSAVQFEKGNILNVIREAFSRYNIGRQFIEFELTESVVMKDPEESARHLYALKSLGVKLSLDDFGTGYSSLAYLKRFPFDVVKIDRSFVSSITRNPEDAAIAIAVINMAHNLKLRVVAEGVETLAQLHYLRRNFCDEMQGYYFSKPVPEQNFKNFLIEKKGIVFDLDDQLVGDTLLFVDDDIRNQSAIKRIVRAEKYNILTATTGEEALDLLAVNSVQVIVSDQRMPDMTGTEFLTIVKDLYPDTVRIILSGHTDLEAAIESVNKGAVYKFLTKPWDAEILLQVIRDAFRRQRAAN